MYRPMMTEVRGGTLLVLIIKVHFPTKQAFELGSNPNIPDRI